MRALHIQKSLLAAIATLSFAAQAQASDLCSGSGIHQSCLNTSRNDYSYSHNGKTQTGNYSKTGQRLYHDAQKAGNTGYNQPMFGTALNTTKSVRNAQLYKGMNNLQPSQK